MNKSLRKKPFNKTHIRTHKSVLFMTITKVYVLFVKHSIEMLELNSNNNILNFFNEIEQKREIENRNCNYHRERLAFVEIT